MTVYLEEMREALEKRIDKINNAYDSLITIIEELKKNENIAVDENWFNKTIIDISNLSEENVNLLWSLEKELENMGVVCTSTTETYVNRL